MVNQGKKRHTIENEDDEDDDNINDEEEKDEDEHEDKDENTEDEDSTKHNDITQSKYNMMTNSYTIILLTYCFRYGVLWS